MKKLMVALLSAIVACGAWADTETVNGYTWTYEITDGKASIYGTSSAPCISPAPTGAVTIPASLGGKPVTKIGPFAFTECSGMTSVLIPNGVTSIASYAFYDCSGLTTVPIPSSVTIVGGYAFVDCTGLVSATIPCSVTTIGNYTFKGCTSLVHAVLPASFETATNIDKILLGCPVYAFGNVEYRDVNVEVAGGIAWAFTVSGGKATVGGGAYDWAIPANTVGAIAIPSKLGGYPVTAIRKYAFCACESLTGVTIPSRVTRIGDFAFNGCTRLEYAVLPASFETATNIDKVFQDCPVYSKYHVEYRDVNVKVVDGIAWAYTVSDGKATVGGGANGWAIPTDTVGDIVIPSTLGGYPVTAIESHAFWWCGGLTSVTIPSSVTSIGSFTFYFCSELMSVTYLGNCPEVGDYFYHNTPSDLVSIVPEGNATWSEALTAGTWQGRAIMTGTTASLTIGGGKTSMSRTYSCEAKTGESFSVACSGSWTATASASWITITSGASGSGNGTIKYTLAANTGTSKREGTIKVKCGSITRTCSITQDKPLLIGGKTSLSRTYENTKQSGCYFSVTCSQSPWTAVSSASWVTLTSDSKSGTGSGKVTYSVAANTTSSQRSATIKVTSRSLTRTCTITQKAGAEPTLTIGGGKTSMSRQYSCEPKTGESFSVACNGSWTATASASWITITTGKSGSGNGTIKYSLAENTGTSKREGTIKVKCGSITRTCTITQDKPLLIANNTSMTRTYEAAKQTGCYFSVTCSQSPWTAVSSASWVTVKTTSGTGTAKLYYDVAANSSTSQRTATIKVTSRGLTRTCTIKQKGK